MGQAAVLEETEFQTDDPDVARQFLGDAFGESQLRVKTPIVEDRVLSVHRLGMADINVSDVSTPCEIEMKMSGQDDEILFATILDGHVSIDHGRETSDLGPGDVVVPNQPGAEWVHRVHPVSNITIGISERLLRAVAGADSSKTDPQVVLSPKPRQGREPLWREASDFIRRLMGDQAAATAPLVIGPAQRLVAAAALFVFPNRLVEQDEGPDHQGGSDLLRRAVAFIESDPQRDMSIGDVARESYASPRAVQTAFRKHLDTTPLAYLRRVRLQHAREDLLAATPDTGATVASISMRWGFSNPGRFAVLYRAEFGQSPSETLRG